MIPLQRSSIPSQHDRSPIRASPRSASANATQPEILKGKQPALDERFKDYLNRIIKNGRILASLIDEILDISKVEAGKLQLESIACSLRSLLDEVCGLFIHQAHDKGLILSVAWEDGAPDTVVTDPIRLRQVMTNVIGNAVKFTEQGRIDIIVRAEDRTADGKVPVEIRVRDTGIGFTPGQQANLFQAFSQVDASMTRQYGGTGLGLSLSKGLAQLLGGDIILAESTPGLGSLFVIKIPFLTPENDAIHTGDLPAPREGAAHAVSGRTGMKVLFAEDALDTQTIVSEILGEIGAEVVLAGNGQEALEKAATDHFDVILMDIQMPVMDGYSAVIELRRRGYSGPIVALTAHAMQTEKDRCLKAGFDDFLAKPIQIPALLDTVLKLSGQK